MAFFSVFQRRKPTLVFLLLTFSISLTQAQTVKGKIVDEENIGIPDVAVRLDGTKYTALTNGAGVFRFFELPQGTYRLLIDDDYETDAVSFDLTNTGIDLGTIQAKRASIVVTGDITTITIDDLEQIEEDESSNFSSLLTASRDPFDRSVAFNLSVLRYRSRGYNNEDVHQYLNGMPTNDLDDGRVVWNTWGGLNDVTRVQTNNLNLRPSDFSFGGLGGASMIDLRASVQRVQSKAVYSLSNRSYTHRLMYTHSTGMMANGWAVTVAGSKRWAQSGYIPGTHYDAYSYFLSVDRKLTANQQLNFVVLGAPLRRGKSSPAVQEIYDLAGSNFYNPNWGYQNGEVRNAREDRIHQPILMLRHDAEIGDKTQITTTASYQFGKYGNTRLDWYLAPDPRPDYYRKLPSFQTSPEIAGQVAAFYQDEANRQLNWDRLYQINSQRILTVFDADGVTGNERTGLLSAYIIEEQRFDTEKASVNAWLAHYFSPSLTLNAGVNYLSETAHNFKVLDDLLGGEFYVDYDEFAIRDFPSSNDARQGDLNRPNRILQEGDIFGYDYDVVTTRGGAWAQLQYAGPTVDVFGSVQAEQVGFFRNGYVRNGLFPDNSEGKSETFNFFNYGLKGGITYKINGRNYLYGVASHRTRAPFSRYAFLSPRTRNETLDGLTSEKIMGLEAGYNFRLPLVKGRLSGFFTRFQDQIDNASFYFDDLNTFVNYTMQGIDKQHAGVELGAEITLPKGFSLEVAGAKAQNIFTSRPLATITQDNSSVLLAEDRVVYQNNYFVPGSPQTAASMTIRYNSPDFWFASVTANYLTDLYLDFNPDRRTVAATDPFPLEGNEALWASIIDQEKAPDIFTLNFFGGKSWKIDDYIVALNVSVGNILNATDLITGGFEQYRFDYLTKDVDRFPPKYFYSYGRNYSINLSVRI